MKTLKAFEFPESGHRGAYDWAKLLDGKIYQLEEGKDFTSKPENFLMMARARAKKAGKTLNAAKVEGGVVIQAFPLTEEQKKEAEKKAAPRKEKKKAGEKTEGGPEPAPAQE